MNVIITGICTYDPSKPEGGTADVVTFVMPNGRAWTRSLRKPTVYIPPHQPFIITDLKNAARRNDGTFEGRLPDGLVGGEFVYWKLDNEDLKIRGQATTGVKFGDTRDVIHLVDLCPDAVLDEEYKDGADAVVAARVMFTAGTLTVESTTEGRYKFEICNGRQETAPKPIADRLKMSLFDLPLELDGTLIVEVKAFSGSSTNNIVLRPQPQALIDVFVVNAPEVDLAAVVTKTPNHVHENSNLHFELYYKVSVNVPTEVVPVPIFVPDEEELSEPDAFGTPPTPGTDGCPPTAGSSGG